MAFTYNQKDGFLQCEKPSFSKQKAVFRNHEDGP